MPTARYSTLLSQLPSSDSKFRSDRQLLDLFNERQDQTAFTAIVSRHGPMVLGVCRRILGTMHDAEDAFQATFLLLAQKSARIIPGDAVGPWLHGVAYRVALKSRTMLMRRQRHERLAALNRPEGQSGSSPTTDLCSILDHELQRLPRPYRLLVILCDLQGGTFREVARQLQLPVGTLSGRLKRGRELLAQRLARRGITLSTTILALMLTEQAGAQVPSHYIIATVRSALAWNAAESIIPSVVSPKVVILVKGTATAMIWNPLKLVTGVGLLTLLLSAGWLVSASTAQDKIANPRLPAITSNDVSSAQHDNAQYQVQLTLYELNADKIQYEVVSRPKLMMHAHTKASFQLGQMEGMKSSKVTPDWWITGFEAELEVQPQQNNEVILQMRAQQTKVREKKSDAFITEAHVETIVQVCKLSESIDLPWEPFGRIGKLEVKVIKMEGSLEKETLSKPTITRQVFTLTRADASIIDTLLKQKDHNKLNMVEFDPRTNSVIVEGTAEQVKQCSETIRKLDQVVKAQPKPSQSINLEPIYANPLASRVTGVRLMVNVGNDFQLNKVLVAAKHLNKDKPKVELEYDVSKRLLYIRVLAEDLKLSELNGLLESDNGVKENR